MIRFLILCIFSLFCFSCANRLSPTSQGKTVIRNDKAPDYSNLQFWAAHPWKTDPSDSLPAALMNQPRDSTVDVFFIHPTTFGKKKFNGQTNAAIDDETVNNKTDFSTILYQASAFNGPTRVFAPRYRQAHLSAYFTMDTATAIQAFNFAYADVKAAFDHYLKFYNNGRPIIIASHSQGTTHAQRLLKEYFDNGGNLRNRLIAAYLVGMMIPKNLFTSLQPCKDSVATGCFCAWRTFKRGYTGRFVNDGTPVTNPINWRTDGEPATLSQNLGGVGKNFNALKPGLTDAQIHNSVVWAQTPKIPGKWRLALIKNYHIGDINLYYMNIRKNVVQRIGAFWK